MAFPARTSPKLGLERAQETPPDARRGTRAWGARRATKALLGSGNLLQAPGSLHLHSCLPPSWSQPPGAVSPLRAMADHRFRRRHGLPEPNHHVLQTPAAGKTLLLAAGACLRWTVLAKLTPCKLPEINPLANHHSGLLRDTQKQHHWIKGNPLIHPQAFPPKQAAASSLYKHKLNRHSLASFSERARALEPKLSRTTQQGKFPLLQFKWSSTLHASLSRC